MRNTSYWQLGMLLVFVLVGIVLGLLTTFLIRQWTPDSVWSGLGGAGTLVITFGPPALWITVMYLLASKIISLVGAKGRAEKAQAKADRPTKRKRRKKS